MARFNRDEAQYFENKVVENFTAANALYLESKYNAASNRLYYTFVLLGLMNAARYGEEISEDCYFNHSTKRIDKTKILNCAKGLKIRRYADFKTFMRRAEAARVKADYLSESVTKEEIEELFPKFEKLLIEEGINI